ncbi:MAG: hypothetical protein BXU00_00965 [Candidatus Nanoclepta minutus]|uniref:glucose-6-phosphate isomerase n=1 Tax=Candidatus Nanoclepta minutus TaxID=1940235 RepID=A0A397WQ38_9ARCH|nr:MAG: hypothetical protein BXU00_00965 [Candidatus Nanoclepta minutus]
MIVLDDYLGIEIDEKYNLRLNGRIIEPKVRRKKDMEPVLLEYDGEDEEMYYMYRGIFREEDEKQFQDYRIRHDITVVPNKMVGKEYNKTFGHYHPDNYPELYEVIRGEAIFIMQSRDFKSLILIRAKRGDQILILPGYGHVMVNVGREPLITSNLVYWDFESDYSVFRERRGAMVYITEDGIKVNDSYPLDFEIIKLEAKKIFEENIYKEFINNPKKFGFLKEKFNF